MADRVLPPGISESAFDRALAAFGAAIGAQYVFTDDEDRETYLDLHAMGDADSHAPSAAIAPGSVEDVQAVMRIANEHKIPLWTISRGKNLGYGGAAPVMKGSVVLDLSRMNRIIEVNTELAYCTVEPGVGFFDLFDYLQENKIPLWMATPGNSWGSVAGNALDRGNSGFPYGDHAGKICGLEVVLPDGSLLRTGMGAMSGNKTWPLFKYGYGPSWDQMFTQSNFGVVTKLNLWLMPEPESTLALSVEIPEMDDLTWAVDTLFSLKLRGVLQQNPQVASYMRFMGLKTQRHEWYDGPGAMPEDVIKTMLKSFNGGWWAVNLRLYGWEDVNASIARVIKDAFSKHMKAEFKETVWRKGDPFERSGAGIPTVLPLQLTNWRGGRGAHITFSPALPPDGKAALKQYKSAHDRFNEFGFDHYTGLTMGERHMINTNGIIFNRDDKDMVANARKLFDALLSDCVKERYAEYRTHISYMDAVADSFDFNNGAMARLNEKVKNMLDPNGIIAPGKQGIWPTAYKTQRS